MANHNSCAEADFGRAAGRLWRGRWFVPDSLPARPTSCKVSTDPGSAASMPTAAPKQWPNQSRRIISWSPLLKEKALKEDTGRIAAGAQV